MELQIVQLPKIKDPRGNLTFLQNQDQYPFDVKRVFWTYDVPSGGKRGGHAYQVQKELIISLSGSFDVVVTQKDGQIRKFSLNRPNYGLYLPENTWRHMENFSTNSLSLHLSNKAYNEADYVRDFRKFTNKS